MKPSGAVINLVGLPRDDLLLVAERACSALCNIANNLTSDEGDRDYTEEKFGLDGVEVVEMAYDNMIIGARATLDRIRALIPKG